MKGDGCRVPPGDDRHVPDRPDDAAHPAPEQEGPEQGPDSSDWKWEPVF
jgi:hypothetical protein